MNIHDMFKDQRQLQIDCYPDFINNNTVEERLQDNLHNMIHEIIEVERETNFKHWKQPVQIDWDRVKDELADVFIFFMNACNEVDMDPHEIMIRTDAKMKVNRKRQIDGY